jgi:nascent polypeptide-associated complex subunit beta
MATYSTSRLLKVPCYPSPQLALLSNQYLVHAAVAANTFAIYGVGQEKELTELVPGILNQLGPDSLASLRKLAESYQAIQPGLRGDAGKGIDDDDDDVPELVDTFDVPDDGKGKLEELN